MRFVEFACPTAQEVEELQVRYPKDLDLKSFLVFVKLNWNKLSGSHL